MEILRKEGGYKIVKGIGFNLFGGILLYENESSYISKNFINSKVLGELLKCSSNQFKEKCGKYMTEFNSKKGNSKLPLVYRGY